MREATPVFLVSRGSLGPHCSWRKVTTDSQAAVDYQASLAPEVIKVSLVCLGVRVCLVCLVLRSRVKVFLESLVCLGYPALQASQDPKESPASTASLEGLDPGEMMVVLVSLVILESLVVLVQKVFLESRTDIQVAPEPKASPETQVTQVVVGWTALVEKMGSQEVQGTV